MKTIEETMEQERVSIEQGGLRSKVEELRRGVESFSERLDRLTRLEALLKDRYHKRLEALHDELNRTDGYQGELKSLAKQLKKNKARQSILKKQIADLKRHKEIVRQTMKQVAGYEKSSGEQIEVIREEHEILSRQVHDLLQMLELAEQAELSEEELGIVCQRVRARKELLEEHEIDLRKRTIDLLFELYIPPRNRRIKW